MFISVFQCYISEHFFLLFWKLHFYNKGLVARYTPGWHSYLLLVQCLESYLFITLQSLAQEQLKYLLYCFIRLIFQLTKQILNRNLGEKIQEHSTILFYLGFLELFAGLYVFPHKISSFNLCLRSTIGAQHRVLFE